MRKIRLKNFKAIRLPYDGNGINIGVDNCFLSKKLSLDTPINVKTPLGNVYSIKAFIAGATNSSYPKEYLSTLLPVNSNVEFTTARPINFKAAVAYITAAYLISNVDIQEALRNNKKHFEMISISEKTDPLGSKFINHKRVYKYGFYLKILTIFEIMIKNDMFTRENILKQIDHLKEDKSKDVFAGMEWLKNK